jgi:hypothetical protein
MAIDVTFDFRTDAGGKDPDSHSPTLRRYHRLLWSKPLPSGAFFDLSDTTPGKYLYHHSNLGEFHLTSDSVIQTFTRWKRTRGLSEQFSPSENEAFFSLAYTIGGMLIFPGNLISGKKNINAERGFNYSICDRLDLTLECIRRHYMGLESPLASTLLRYADFFALFDSFSGYVRFFLLDDLLTEDFGVKFFMAFHDFRSPSFPTDMSDYVRFRQLSIDFIKARNHRIEQIYG